ALFECYIKSHSTPAQGCPGRKYSRWSRVGRMSRLMDRLIADGAGTGSLVAVARERRLFRGFKPISPSWVDETALALLGRALERTEPVSLNLLYPAPAGDVSVLLAAQVL